MAKLKCWRKTNLVTNPKSKVVYANKDGYKLLWIRKSDAYGGKIRLGGVNKRGYVKDKYFDTEKEAIKFTKDWMKSHDKC